MRTFTTADLNKKVGDITDAARREPVLLTHHRKPRFVLMSVETYESLTQAKAADKRTGFTLEAMPDDVADGLLALADQYEREGRDDDV
ncbi:type II toxin-antitoxin system Phd/YefM family antitoxin [Microvirga aerilata]|jgi:prevent-host-death family protein|uniref:Antitoxin n=1 Tax=Microvirga aerilata TaxID=670292 RepID=A0A937D4Q2_9HYPH|nr:type II toxin-antitoxin system Phd/YefM family antitoxin [Microvirga aerilata]MBL0407790.1 type II toxin-antitoxin system Phd/YefM family antitoxin [Microvirga aerilata]